MSIINKPDYKVFANEAKTGEIETFPDILRGWGVTIDRTAGKPPMEWFNAIGKRADEWMMYLSQRGIVEWDSAVDYPQSAVVQHAGKFYVAKKQTKEQQPDKSQNDWMLFADAIGVTKSISDALNTRLEKAKNGSDILDAKEFVKNLGLGDVKEKAENAYPKTGGTIEGKVFTTSDIDAKGWVGATKLFDRYPNGRWSQAYTEAFPPTATAVGAYSKTEVNNTFALKTSKDTFTCGNLHVEATHDYAGVIFRRPDGYNTALHANPDTDKNMLTLRYRNRSDNTLSYVNIPKKDGTVALESQLLGIGQRWTDVTSSRFNDTRYNNDTGKSIVVYVESAKTDKRTGDFSMGGEVDGVRVGYFWASTIVIHSFSFIVPPGSHYIVRAGWGTNLTSDAITRWVELR